MLTLESLRSEYAAMREQRERLWADFNRALGAEQQIEHLIQRLQSHESDTPDQPAANS